MLLANPFVSAYAESDGLGKAIFCALFFLSAVSWWILIHKGWIFWQMHKLSIEFSSLFSEKDPLGLRFAKPILSQKSEIPHPFFEIYKRAKQSALLRLDKNLVYAPANSPYLHAKDLELIGAQIDLAIAHQAKILEKNLFLLPTIITLAPFLGLLGTVWGILLTFAQIHQKGLAAVNSSSMLSGIALALATTVIGLVVAIPALIGNSYLKNALRNALLDMENFAQTLLQSLEIHYQQSPHAQTAQPSLK